jgi:hypothetical protein
MLSGTDHERLCGGPSGPMLAGFRSGRVLGLAAFCIRCIEAARDHICSHAQALRRRFSGSRPGRGRVGHGRTTAGADGRGTDLRFNDNAGEGMT